MMALSRRTSERVRVVQAHMQGGFGPYGGGPGMPALPPHSLGYQKSGFMQPQQQRMEVTVPVPEARVSLLFQLPASLLPCTIPSVCCDSTQILLATLHLTRYNSCSTLLGAGSSFLD